MPFDDFFDQAAEALVTRAQSIKHSKRHLFARQGKCFECGRLTAQFMPVVKLRCFHCRDRVREQLRGTVSLCPLSHEGALSNTSTGDLSIINEE